MYIKSKAIKLAVVIIIVAISVWCIYVCDKYIVLISIFLQILRNLYQYITSHTKRIYYIRDSQIELNVISYILINILIVIFTKLISLADSVFRFILNQPQYIITRINQQRIIENNNFHDERPEKCHICYENDEPSEMSCGHYCCRQCIVNSRRTTCPFCRKQIFLTPEEENAMDIYQVVQRERIYNIFDILANYIDSYTPIDF